MTVQQTAAEMTLTRGRGVPGWARELVFLVGGSAALAISAQIVVALPMVISPVPITGQSLVLLVIAALYGSRRGVLCVTAYLTQGALGLPVFAAGGAGAIHLVGPTGGYLIGFLGAAWVVGSLVEQGRGRGLLSLTVVMALGTATIFLCGLVWLAFYVGPTRLLAAGLLPFLPGAVVKVALASLIVWIWHKTVQ